MTWIALIQSIEGLKSKHWGFPEKKKKEFCLETVTQKSCVSFHPAGLLWRFWTRDCALSSFLSLLLTGPPYRFWICQLPLSLEPIPKDKLISLSLFPSPHPIPLHPSCILFVLIYSISLKNSDWYRFWYPEVRCCCSKYLKLWKWLWNWIMSRGWKDSEACDRKSLDYPVCCTWGSKSSRWDL